MLKLTPPTTEPRWLDILDGVRIRVKPVTVAAILVARQAAADVLKAAGTEATIEAGIAFTRSLALQSIEEWEGVGDANGKVVDPDAETIGALLDIFPAFDAIDRLFVAPALTGFEQKNV